jgi:hypothetical protein
MKIDFKKEYNISGSDFITILLLSPLLLVYRAWTIYIIFRWFIPQLADIKIAIGSIFAVAILFSFIETKFTEKTIAVRIISELCYPAINLLMAYIIHIIVG